MCKWSEVRQAGGPDRPMVLCEARDQSGPVIGPAENSSSNFTLSSCCSSPSQTYSFYITFLLFLNFHSLFVLTRLCPNAFTMDRSLDEIIAERPVSFQAPTGRNNSWQCSSNGQIRNRTRTRARTVVVVLRVNAVMVWKRYRCLCFCFIVGSFVLTYGSGCYFRSSLLTLLSNPPPYSTFPRDWYFRAR